MQRDICDNLLRPMEKLGMLTFYAVPNGGWRSPVEAGILVGQGVRAGVPDLVVLFSGGRSLYIELKAEKGRLSEKQVKWRDRLLGMGFAWGIAKTVDEAAALLNMFVTQQTAGAA